MGWGEPQQPQDDGELRMEHEAAIGRIDFLSDENGSLRATLATARFVADYWRQAMLASDESRWAAHPLCMVLAALDGEESPVECGIDDSEWDAFTAARSGRPT